MDKYLSIFSGQMEALLAKEIAREKPLGRMLKLS